MAGRVKSTTMTEAERPREQYTVKPLSRTLVGNKIVHHWDGVASIAYRSFANYIFILDLTPGFNGLGNVPQRQLQSETRSINVLGFGATYIRVLTAGRSRIGPTILTVCDESHYRITKETPISHPRVCLLWLSVRKYYDVIKWNHLPRYWPFVWGIHRSPVNSPNKGQWRGALMFSLICAWTSVWVNNWGASDLRRHRADYDVTVMVIVLQPDRAISKWVKWSILTEISQGTHIYVSEPGKRWFK